MPTYVYKCEACEYEFEEFQWMSEATLTKCPECKRKKLYRKPVAGALTLIYDSPTTFGQQAEINAKRLGKEQLELKAKAIKEKKIDLLSDKLSAGASLVDKNKEAETPFWRSGKKPLNLKKIPDVKRYIEKGY